MGGEDADDPPFRDAEEWLEQRGIERRPIQVDASEEEADRESGPPGGSAPPAPPPAEREGAGRDSDEPSGPPGPSGRSGDEARGKREDERGNSSSQVERANSSSPVEVAEAVAFARRSTAQSPQSEQRLAGKLAGKGYDETVVERALERCREQGIVDDDALAASFVDERRRKGHARSRIGRDLRKRGFDSATIERALGAIEDRDEEQVALDLARRRADGMGEEDTETVFRRIVGYLARRGYAEGLARKVARKAVFDG